MCGILGMAFQEGHTMRDNEEVREIYKKLLIESNLRGSDATGTVFISLLNAMVIKHHIPARRFVETDYYKDVARRRIKMDGPLKNKGEEPFVIMGHTRLKTKGTPTDIHNNHPIVANRIIGVHNGTIGNDDKLFQDYKKDGIKRKGRVDSEVIFRLIDHFAFNRNMPMNRAIYKTVEITTGCAACAVVNTAEPWVIWLFRYNNPITIYRYPKRGLIMFASTDKFMDVATEGFDLGDSEIISLENEEMIAINAKQNKVAGPLKLRRPTFAYNDCGAFA